jgi:hypothetical protein
MGIMLKLHDEYPEEVQKSTQLSTTKDGAGDVFICAMQ